MWKPRKRAGRKDLGSSEYLDTRTLLSATLTGDVLTIAGTADADSIRVRRDGDNLQVSINGEESTFVSADVTAIDVDAGAGNDRINLSGVAQGATVSGGDGDDRIIGTNGNDVITGKVCVCWCE